MNSKVRESSDRYVTVHRANGEIVKSGANVALGDSLWALLEVDGSVKNAGGEIVMEASAPIFPNGHCGNTRSLNRNSTIYIPMNATSPIAIWGGRACFL